MAAPRVSVVVPAFNEPPLILEQSLGSVMSQSFSDFECIVVDESTDPASADACGAICNSDSRFRHIRPAQRLGLAASLNHGITLARGELIARFDSDDICIGKRLEWQVAFMNAHADVGVLGGGLEIMDEGGKTLAFRDYPAEHEGIERRLHTTTSIAHPTVMMRKQLVQSLGGYNPEFRFAEDLDLWLRMINHGARFANLDQVLVRYRQQNTRRNPQHWRYNLRARSRNFASRHGPRRALGICAVGLWTCVPASVQEAVFRAFLLRQPSARTNEVG